MRFLHRYLPVSLVLVTLNLMPVSLAYAHLMAAQHGTLNIVNDGVFMVLSLPASAFQGIDDDNDGKVSMIEFNNHRAAIVSAIRENVILSDAEGTLALREVLLSPVAQHDTSEESISQLTIMGRFSLNDIASPLRIEIGLYGKGVTEQSLEIAATRSYDRRRDIFELTPAAPASLLFSSSL
ncbi:MAG: hypothetical protein KDI33_07755 [Halioglobus sp.]|nr:hypothetical protein [Halioglobus sp.]